MFHKKHSFINNDQRLHSFYLTSKVVDAVGEAKWNQGLEFVGIPHQSWFNMVVVKDDVRHIYFSLNLFYKMLLLLEFRLKAE